MKIRVLFFAQFRDAWGGSERFLELPDHWTAAQVIQGLLNAPEGSLLRGLPLRCAVNEEFVDEGRELTDGDTLALLPPIAGG